MNFRNTLFSILLLPISFSLFAQKMEVIRTSAVDRSSPVSNVFVDADNQKWVANKLGLFKVFSPGKGSKVELKATDWSLLKTHDGNADLRFPLETLLGQMGTEGQAIKSRQDRINTATYNEAKDQLWVGTEEAGLFEFKTKPSLHLVKRYHSGNSKLASNTINTLYLDGRGQLWAGTYSGALVGKDGKWNLKEKGFSFLAFAQNGTDVWAMADGLLWKVNSRGSWDPVDIDEDLIEGEVADIAFDQDGLLWVVSEIVARYDPATDEATVFGPAIGFTSQDVFCVAVDQNNGVWIGTNDKGLYLIQKASSLYLACEVDKAVSCGENKNDGALKVTVSGGDAPYKYEWDGGLTGENPQNLAPGEYSVTVTDSRGKSNSASVVLKDPNISLEIKQDKPASPEGAADGVASLKASGGKPGYSYAWDNGESTATASKLAEGLHTVTVTDRNGCVGYGSIKISKQVGKLSVLLSQIGELKCAGDKTAGLKIEVKGGKRPFDFKWNSDDIVLLNGETGYELSAGIYSVTVTDASGQNASAEVEVEAREIIKADITVNSPASTGNEDGKATVNVSGGTGDYRFKWNDGEATQEAVSLPPGNISVTVTDSEGCQTVANSNISEDILPLKVSISKVASIQCAEGSDGILQADVTGGKGPFRFQWSDAISEKKTAEGLPAGNYSVSVVDAAGTTASADFFLRPPNAIYLSIEDVKPASTNNEDGSARVEASGGSGHFTYLWDTGETTPKATRLGPSVHEVKVTDDKGCQSTATVEITENILALSVSISQTNEVKCAGNSEGDLKAKISGGKGPFQYKWSSGGHEATAIGLPAGKHSLTITDATGASANAGFTIKEPKPLTVLAVAKSAASTGNADGKATAKASGGTGKYSFQWDNGEASGEASKLAPGEHSVTATDENGCTATAAISITENILPLSIAISQTKKISCAGGANAGLQASISGGKGPFKYEWSNGSGEESISSLKAGQYAVTLTDATGSTSTAEFSIKEPRPLSLSAVAKSAASTGNADGKASAKASGGTGKYSFRWDNGEASETASKLAPGEHSVTATDENGCTATAAISITENILPLSIAISQTKKISCAGGGEAELQASISGGKGPFKYKWSNGSKKESASGLKAGKYTVTLTDARGSTATAGFSVKEPKPLTASASVVAPASTDNEDGKATAKAAGGTGKYLFQWDNGEASATANKLAPGEHSVTATDDKGCTATAALSITENILPLSIAISQNKNVSCAGGKTGALEAAVSGGKKPFSFKWNKEGAEGKTIAGLAADRYSVTVTDATGTTATASAKVAEPEAIRIATIADAPASTGNSDGKATAKASGGTGNFNYKWDNGETARTAVKLAPGTHAVTITDENGCEAEGVVEITENVLPLKVAIEQTSKIKCAGDNNAAIKIERSGGKAPFDFKWNKEGLNEGGGSGLAPGEYAVSVSDASGKNTTASIKISEPPPLFIELAKTSRASSERYKDGKAELIISGGTGAYTIDWGNGETERAAKKLAAGQHTVEVRDENGCLAKLDFETKIRTMPELTAATLRAGETINMKKVFFQPDSTNMDPSSLPTVDELFEFLDENPTVVIEVGGHTNGVPPPDFCDKLSTARAKSVADYLIGKGIDKRRIAYKGYGKRKPIASNKTPEGRKKNQRVEIKILRLEGDGG
ncbi:MAG TPA: hypothetical protein ENJ95_11260 [Bacteroidetes bacterium]|nr:hypothetical protein [Bacteroidota bacterium]